MNSARRWDTSPWFKPNLEGGSTSRVVVALVMMVLSVHAYAQDPLLRIRRSGVQVESMTWGFSDGSGLGPWMPAECYAPVTVMVSSGDHAVQGALILEYAQDASQNARIIAPFATTPNATTPVQLLACLPRQCQKVTLTLTDGSRSTKREFTGAIGNDGVPQTPSASSRIGMLAGLNAPYPLTEEVPTPAFATGVAAIQPGGTPPVVWWQSATSAKLTTLPDAWIAYESLSVVMASEQDVMQAPVPAREALHEWVRAGGRLILHASQAGQRTFDALPAEVRHSVILENPRELTLVDVSNGADGIRLVKRRTPARLLRVTENGRRAGWIARYSVEESADSGTGLTAYGPCGLGMVAIIGMDPQSISGTDVQAYPNLWRDIVKPLMPHWAISPSQQDAWAWYISSGPDAATAAGIAQVLDSITTTPPLGAGFFTVTMFAVGALGLAIGPVGRVVLKRRGRLSASWLAAVVCIFVASGLGWLIPSLMRSGETSVARWSLVDILCDEKGGVREAWQTSITCVFAGHPGTISLPTMPQSDGDTAPTSWWRGVSAQPDSSPTGSNQPPLTMLYTPGGATQRRGMPLSPLNFGQWTYRAFLDHDTSVPVSLVPLNLELSHAAGVYTLKVRGLPEGAAVNQSEVVLGDSRVVLAAESGGDARVFVLTGRARNPRNPTDRFTSDEEQIAMQASYQYGWSGSALQRDLLPIARSRNAAFESRIRSGGAVGVRLTISGLPLEWNAQGWDPVSTRRDVVVRALLDADAVKGLDGTKGEESPEEESR